MNINSGVMKDNNLRLIMSHVRARKQVSRKELAQITGLTPATVTNLVKELLAEDLVLETGRGKSRSGPRPILLEINPGWGYIIGIELTVTDIICVLTDFHEDVLAHSTTPFDINAGREAVLDLLIAQIDQIVAAAAIPRDSVRGIGIVSAGPLNRAAGEMIAPPNFPGWAGTPIRQIIEDQTGIPVWFDKETQAAALGEAWFGTAADSQILFVCNVLQIGIGGGILIDSKAYRGHRENAGNIGHTKVLLEGDLCTCGETGCLETVADGRAAVRTVQAAYLADPGAFVDWDIASPTDITFDFVVQAAEEDFAPCRDAVVTCARYLGMALANVIRTVAPDTVVLCGEFADRSPLFVRECIASTRARHNQDQEDVRMYHSEIGPEIAALGGVAVVLDIVGVRLGNN